MGGMMGDPDDEGLFEQRPGGSESRRKPRQRDGRAQAQARTCRCVPATAEQSEGTMGGEQAGRGRPGLSGVTRPTADSLSEKEPPDGSDGT